MGKFSPGCGQLHPCRKCQAKTARCELWNDDEGHEDVRYTCTDAACGFVRWVDGIDS